MIGIWQAYAGTFLVITAVATLAAFGLPLLIVPLRWARILRWEIPRPVSWRRFWADHWVLSSVFLRSTASRLRSCRPPSHFYSNCCCGCWWQCWRCTPTGAPQEQPITETIEIALWVVLILATLAFMPGVTMRVEQADPSKAKGGTADRGTPTCRSRSGMQTAEWTSPTCTAGDRGVSGRPGTAEIRVGRERSDSRRRDAGRRTRRAAYVPDQLTRLLPFRPSHSWPHRRGGADRETAVQRARLGL